ncbi:hypothetical protein AB0H88_05740 [Nonomuraea sp. NPDC050680]|uniref:hypothetical protein n=1 Tax=Nonomuraea sp. NPDC050680 TaxID=3154630 RepID=UPI0033E963E4
MATPTKPQRSARLVAGSAKAAQGSARYLDERLGLAGWLGPNLRKLFPSHWSFLLGEFALYSFVLLVLTGTFLVFFYKPNPDVAFASVRELSLDIRGGLLVRQMHHWAAMILLFYPFLERRFTGDRRVHNLLDRPSHAPVRTALGVAVITFFTVLWAGTWVSELPPDPRAPMPLLTAPHETYLWIVYGLRAALFVLPPIAYAITLAVCRSRARR